MQETAAVASLETGSQAAKNEADYRRHRGFTLDALSFFVADAQTGFGPFVAGYLSGRGWSNGDIGTVLSVGTVAALASQLPGGALVDRLHDKRVGAAAAWVTMAAAAVLFAVAPTRILITLAEILHSCATAMLSPAIAALSLAVVGRKALGERLGRNARFAAIGNAGAAAALGVAGRHWGPTSVFWLTAAFVIPGIALLFRLPDPRQGPGSPDIAEKARKTDWRSWVDDLKGLLGHKGVLAFASCIGLFHLGNVALMPLASTLLTRTAGDNATLFISACVIGPQIVVALFSPWIGRTEERQGVRMVMFWGFAAIPIRAVLLSGASTLDPQLIPYAIVAAQIFDGVSAAVFGVSLPIMAADLTRGSNRFNLCLGFFGVANTIGAAIGTTLAGHLADHVGFGVTFLILALCGTVASGSVLLAIADGAGRRRLFRYRRPAGA